MGIDLPEGYWLKEDQGNKLCIGLQFGGHFDGESELILPKALLEKFCSNDAWRRDTVDRFSRIVFLGAPGMNIPIPQEEARKDGIVPDDWA